MTAGIYKITNSVDEKLYVGSASNLRERWNRHRSFLARGQHVNRRLQTAWNAHGPEVFVFSVLETVADRSMLIAREQFWLDELCAVHHGYNLAPVAGSSFLGLRHSDATKEKCRAAKLGKPQPPHVTEALRRANLGRKFSPEHRALLAAASSRKHSPESTEKTAAAHRGMKRSEETRRRMSEAMKGKRSWLGRKHSDETKRRISATKRGVAFAVTDLGVIFPEEQR